MFRRREPVPYAFVAEADRFRSNVTPPPRPRADAGQIAHRCLIALLAVGSLAGAVLLGAPALDANNPGTTATPVTEIADGR
ncbi:MULTISPECIES: hypothetical protein [Streptomyces]|uniref:Uncharacterized protein n=1 Tax=Streptomyces lycii TaxID=2654337 RepID=A0ABQ7FLS3_9ACTN|nr:MULTISPECIES: hypothetical protein [Streptomyces]KAF4408726.1 hypothetical protein GCU69_12750 [Streptomyces lycii]PGH52474.1 hypothetical protein CRI70_01205 [Streptomyces sp. Ru87]